MGKDAGVLQACSCISTAAEGGSHVMMRMMAMLDMCAGKTYTPAQADEFVPRPCLKRTQRHYATADASICDSARNSGLL